jgi:hypothetical protein
MIFFWDFPPATEVLTTFNSPSCSIFSSMLTVKAWTKGGKILGETVNQ